METTRETEVLAYTLMHKMHIKPRRLVSLLESFTSREELGETTEATLEQIGFSLVDATNLLLMVRSPKWEELAEQSQVALAHHQVLGITIIPISSKQYPAYLRLLPDPPPLLYAQGNCEVLQSPLSIAIVGTREPTENGVRIAQSMTRYFGEAGFVIVSGLARGIDTVAHEEALACGALTVAVLATPLDTIYPRENCGLAKRIRDHQGVLLSEYPIGAKTHRAAFVQRDRLQSGLSLGVVAVQTRVDGGTMHTADFARKQERLLFCPQPIQGEGEAEANSGVQQLIDQGRARIIRSREEYGRVHQALLDHRTHLVSSPRVEEHLARVKMASFPMVSTTVQQGELFVRDAVDQRLPNAPRYLSPNNMVSEIVALLRMTQPNFDEKTLDDILEQVRQQYQSDRSTSLVRPSRVRQKKTPLQRQDVSKPSIL